LVLDIGEYCHRMCVCGGRASLLNRMRRMEKGDEDLIWLARWLLGRSVPAWRREYDAQGGGDLLSKAVVEASMARLGLGQGSCAHWPGLADGRWQARSILTSHCRRRRLEERGSLEWCPSVGLFQHLCCGDCLDDTSEDYQNCSGMYYVEFGDSREISDVWCSNISVKQNDVWFPFRCLSLWSLVYFFGRVLCVLFYSSSEVIIIIIINNSICIAP